MSFETSLGLPDSVRWKRDAVIQRFENEWENGRQPQIDDYLHEAGDYRADFLVELCCVDLEYRLRAKRTVRVAQDYLERYRTELVGNGAVELFVYDFKARRRRGLNPVIAT